MNDIPDAGLLEQFARTESEAAFAELMRRHVNLVHSVALRHTDNFQHAQEITQAVFIILARKAGSLGRRTVLSGWLYHTARLTAANFRRAEFRRVCREQEAFMQSTLEETTPDSVWHELAPLLDEAMARLGTTDRDAVVLRYFENKSLLEVGVALGVEERAAQKRVGRALEKLRRFFTKRGMAFSATVIAGAMSANSVQAAPIGLTAAVAATAAKGAAISASTLNLVNGALTLMAWKKAKTAIVISMGVLVVAGTAGIYLQAKDSNLAAVAKGIETMARQDAMPINLTNYYTTPASHFDKITQFPGWKTVPVGAQIFANVPLQIDGMICLWGERNANKLNIVFPDDISGIAVKRKFESLYIYHASFFRSPAGTPVYTVVLRYEDGSSVTNQMLYGEDVLDWTTKPDETEVVAPTSARSKIAWVGGAFGGPNGKRPLRFCLTAMVNPQPLREVSAIDLISCKSATAPCIMAMTTGPSGLLKDSRQNQNK